MTRRRLMSGSRRIPARLRARVALPLPVLSANLLIAQLKKEVREGIRIRARLALSQQQRRHHNNPAENAFALLCAQKSVPVLVQLNRRSAVVMSRRCGPLAWNHNNDSMIHYEITVYEGSMARVERNALRTLDQLVEAIIPDEWLEQLDTHRFICDFVGFEAHERGRSFFEALDIVRAMSSYYPDKLAARLRLWLERKSAQL